MKVNLTGNLDLSDFFEMLGDRQVRTIHNFLLEGRAGIFQPNPDHTYTVLETTYGMGVGDDTIYHIFTHKLRRVL